MSSATRSVVVANAGSGKTYLLANRLIRWMIAAYRESVSARHVDPDAGVDRILAITFTRKAAGEILARVLQHLAEGALDEDARRRLADPAQVGPAEAEEYAAVLRQVVDSMHRMSISTIDGFFVRLAGAFGPALGLPDGWRISEDDEDRMQRDRAVAAVIADDPVRATDLAKRMSQGAPRASVRSGIGAALKAPLELWDRTSLDDDSAGAWSALCRDGVRIFPDAKVLAPEVLAAVVARLRSAPLPADATKRWPGAREEFIRLAEGEAWERILESSFGKGIRGTGKYDRKEATAEIREAVTAVFLHGLGCVEIGLRTRINATAELASEVARKLHGIRAEERAFQFGEVTWRIARAWRRAGAPGESELREVLDRRLDDIAIDEFQDTSPMQWAALRPLVDRALAPQGGRFLVVGDPKQSIYGWRGGTPALLAKVGARKELESDVVLDESYRSSPKVLGFVNSVFGDLRARIVRADKCAAKVGHSDALARAGLVPPPHADEAPVLRVLQGWSFVPHRAAERCGALPGMVRAVRAGEGMDAAAEVVAAIVAERVAARPGVRIAVLARKNPMVSACAAAIRRRGIPVSDEGRSELLDSPAVLAITALLRLAAQPDDRVAHWLSTREPVRGILASQGVDGIAEIAPMETLERADDCTRQADAISAHVRRSLASGGLVSWIDGLAAALRPSCGTRDLERLRQLSSLAHAMPDANACDPGRFVQAVEERLQRAGANERVRVMTIHASKGLEFDEVVLASMNEPLGAMRNDAGRWAALAPDPAAAPTAVAPVVSKKLEEHSALLRAFRAEAEVAVAFDSLSAFYVALTRAKQGIHLVCGPLTKGQDAAVTPFWMVADAFQNQDFRAKHLAAEEGACFWTAGDAELGPLALPEGAPVAEPTPAVEWSRRAGMRAVAPPSSHVDEHGLPTLLDEYEGQPDGSRGSLAHGWMERIQWLGPDGPDLSCEREVLDAVAIGIGRAVSDKEARAMRELVTKVCSGSGAIANALRVGRYADWRCDRVEVRNEFPYVARSGDGLQRGRIDRLVLGFRGGRVVQAELLDHKTGAEHCDAAEFERRIAPYRRQMEGYRRVVASMFGIEESAVSYALLMLDRGVVVEG